LFDDDKTQTEDLYSEQINWKKKKQIKKPKKLP